VAKVRTGSLLKVNNLSVLTNITITIQRSNILQITANVSLNNYRPSDDAATGERN